ncbi:N-acetyllactosaminide beta-1,3-N-acetylglucosaminyltransferase 3-like isoform X1 [Oryzias latipes]|uniref:Hexosyltransferase n=2 Tax=Oryzias latipes TaxID=8090 RepID=H2M0N1_ORYLA|nr:N-acetyllactosaminide beta-1,3-N-acetylglucosaminyltransferase 3-like isoform X1 [Oryzias latipes]
MNKCRLLTNNITKKIPSMASATALMTALVVVLYLGFFQDLSGTRISLHDAVEQQDDSHITPTSQISKQRHFWSKCVRDNSVESISGFDTLPDHIKNFLYYQHCLHFPMLLDTPHKCGGPKGSAKVFLLLVIKSSPMNYDRREVLRNTWAKERLQNGVWIRRLFISGTQDDGYNKKRLNRLLALEQRKYNDILQWDFHDSFFNLTLKQILFLEWMERNCPHVRFMLNGDDDVFANTDNMILYLKNLPDNNGSKHLYVGDVIKGAKPIRSPNSKYYIPTQVHNSGPYPAYCGGGGFLLSGYTALIMYNMSHSTPLLPIDDVYLAMCLDKAGLHPESHLGVKTSGLYIPDAKADRYDPCYFREMLLVHRFLSVNMYVMWHDIQNPDLNCSPSSVL